MAPAVEHHIPVTRTARYHTLGDTASPREVWFVLHGHRQLSAYFIRHFAPLDDGTRLIVAPEALNRFYLERTSWQGAGQARVGATWMTREDRLTDIEDYVGYLDALYLRTLEPAGVAAARIVVLGFSQGVATACRWLCRGKARAHRLILWAGPLPPEMDAGPPESFRNLDIVRVLGRNDDMATPEAVAAEDARAAARGITAPITWFDGGHELDADLLRKLAG